MTLPLARLLTVISVNLLLFNSLSLFFVAGKSRSRILDFLFFSMVIHSLFLFSTFGIIITHKTTDGKKWQSHDEITHLRQARMTTMMMLLLLLAVVFTFYLSFLHIVNE